MKYEIKNVLFYASYLIINSSRFFWWFDSQFDFSLTVLSEAEGPKKSGRRRNFVHIQDQVGRGSYKRVGS